MICGSKAPKTTIETKRLQLGKMRDFRGNLTREIGVRKIKMRQARKLAKFRGDVRIGEVIQRKIKPLEMRELEEAAIGIDGPSKITAAEVQFNYMASHLIAYDTIP
ncbi:hypothetical protein H5410_062140 [Solanum commersonii]|uniref:Uncharacterized protein n=1 Tax=Solanum commersonii TaxID=4109 RepID=A0A9J5WBR1_SOLCO|nr:hypothetical protein H5410_062140 [Solanum commersonii]